MNIRRKRKGVASIIGTILFVVVFMVAIGAQAYMSSIQAESIQAAQQVQQLVNQRGAEELIYSSPSSGLTVTNDGAISSNVVAVVLKFANGTVYSLSQTTILPSGASVLVQSIIPGGSCGGATCLSKYNSIISGAAPGSLVGLVTSFGNAFWYTSSSSSGGGAAALVRTTDDASTAGTTVRSTGLTFAMSASTNYAFTAYTEVICGTCVEKFAFQIHTLPAGAALQIVCTGASTESGANLPGGCITSAGVDIQDTTAFSFGALGEEWLVVISGVVTVGSTSGTLQIDFHCTQNCGSVTLKAGAFMVVYQGA